MSTDAVQEVPIVRDHHDRRRSRVEHALEPADGIDVQMVGGLVEQQDIRVGEERLRQEHPELVAGRDIGHRSVMQPLLDLDAEQQLARARLGRVSIELGNLRLQLRRMQIIGVACVGVGIDRVALLQHVPESLVTHHHDVKHAQIFVGELVLLQLAEALARIDRYISGAGLEVPTKNLHERRLAAAVGADQPITIAFAELDGNVFEQRLRAELHGDIGRRQQGISVRWASRLAGRQRRAGNPAF